MPAYVVADMNWIDLDVVRHHEVAYPILVAARSLPQPGCNRGGYMTDLDNHADSLNQLLNKIDKTAANGCLDHPVSIELTDCLREIVEMDSAEA